jgi:membrane protein implicated in regulation of membrane protease activity
MAESTMWWLLAGAAVALELMTGTFYLLMLAIGLAAGALAAHAGAGLNVQLAVATVIGASTVGVWHFIRSRRPPDPPASANPDVNLDVGQTVLVEAWKPDGTADVHYRGARWTAVSAGPVTAAGPHRVREVSGSRLVVEKL